MMNREGMSEAKKMGRRRFLGEASCAAVAGSSALGALLNLNLLGRLAADEVPAGDDYRALVCVFLAGGNDSFNMLIPEGESEYGEYAAVRDTLAIPRKYLLPLEGPLNGQRRLGLHPQMADLKALYEVGQAAFVANIGTLQQPTSLQDYELNPAILPKGLFSHSDQQKQWHTALPDRSSTSGWLGRMSDLVKDLNNGDNFASAISVNGINLAQTAPGTNPYVINENGSKGLSGWNFDNWQYGRAAVTSQLDVEYDNLLQKTFLSRKKQAILLNDVFRAALENSTVPEVDFGGGNLAAQLEMVYRVIEMRSALGVRRQTFFVMLGGWDHHSALLGPHASLLSELNESLSGFQHALNGAGLGQAVTTFTASDFGRSLTSNGQGSDHGWGGNHLVLGGAVRGGTVFGSYPDLHATSSVDVGRGRLLPTTSVDEYFAELACWLGISRTQLPLVLPHLDRFYDLNSENPPLGFMNLES